MTERQPAKLPTAAPASDARAQAEAFDSLFKPTPLELEGGGTLDIPPHPNFGMLDDDATEAYEELIFETESYDREPDTFIPEQRLLDKDGNETGVIVPSETVKGGLLRPYRRTVDGVTTRISPPHSVRVVQVVLGETAYKQLKEGGRSSADVWRVWNLQALEADERRGRPRADESAVGVEAVPPTDSE